MLVKVKDLIMQKFHIKVLPQFSQKQQSPKIARPGLCAHSHIFCKILMLMFWQLAEAEGELDEMTKHRDELQAVVDELEEKVQHSDHNSAKTLPTTLLPWHECTPLFLTLDTGKLANKTCHGLWKKVQDIGCKNRVAGVKRLDVGC